MQIRRARLCESPSPSQSQCREQLRVWLLLGRQRQPSQGLLLQRRQTASRRPKRIDPINGLTGWRSARHGQHGLGHFAEPIAPADKLEKFYARSMRNVRSPVHGHEQIPQFLVAIQGVHHRGFDPAIAFRLPQRRDQSNALLLAGGKHGGG